ncbi:MAG: hypothetical protein WCK04_05015 [Actinomycetes bacterium]
MSLRNSIKQAMALGSAVLIFSFLSFTSISSSVAAGPQGPSCGTHKVQKDEIIAGKLFPKGTYRVNSIGISCAKVLGNKGIFAQFLKLSDQDQLPKPWQFLSGAVGAPKFSSGAGVGFRVQWISP